MDSILQEVPERAMAIFAHPGDAEIACGATLARWADAGCKVALIICTQGDKGSHEPQAIASEVAATRITEVANSAELLGVVEYDVLDHLDGEVENSVALRETLVGHLRRWRPTVVFGHDPTAVFIGSGYVNHHDHREVGLALCDAVAPMSASPLYFPDVGDPHRVTTLLLSGTLETDTWVDVAGYVSVKARALCCHRTQVAGNEVGVEALVQERAVEAAARAGVSAAEGFRRITLAP